MPDQQTSTNETTKIIVRSALHQADEPAERRQRDRRRWFAERRSGVQCYVGIDVSPDRVTMAIARRSPNDQRAAITLDAVTLSEDAGSRQGDWSTHDLVAAVTMLAKRHNVGGAPVTVALGGEPCATRSWFGENEAVDENIRELTERAHRYLGLGRGEKICSYAEMPVDAKHKRAWVTIANRVVVEAASKAVKAAGLRLIHVHHSMTQICSALGRTQADADQPVLIVTRGGDRPELCISFRGRLILDYRPPRTLAAEDQSEEILNLVRAHIKCLRRYTMMQLPHNHDALTRICFLDCEQIPSQVRDQLERELGLQIVPNPLETLAECSDAEDAGKRTSAALTAIATALDGLEQLSPLSGNLAEPLKRKSEIDFKQALRIGWPVAAALLITLGLNLYGSIEGRKLANAQQQLEELEARNLDLKIAQREFELTNAYIDHLNALQQHLQPDGWNNMVRILGRALPRNCWLTRIAIQKNGLWEVRGACFANDAVYEYMEKLNGTNLFNNISLTGVNATQLETGPGFEFGVQGSLRFPLTSAVRPSETASVPSISTYLVPSHAGNTTCPSDRIIDDRKRVKTGKPDDLHRTFDLCRS